MREYISQKVRELQPSGIRAFFDLVLGMPDVISLGVGESDFITPWNICESGIFAIEQGYTSYTSNKGLYKLRLEIQRYLRRKHNLHYNPDSQILITVGVSEALDLAMRAVINPGDKVLIPTPCYVSYGPVVALAGGQPIYLKTDNRRGFKLTPKLIQDNCDDRTKAIILNYPVNPTGASYTKKELETFKKVILKNKLLCITDEVYDELTYDFNHIPFAKLDGAKKSTLYLNGFSKTFAMTGWRVGFACGNEDIISAMTKIHQYTMLCVPIMSQMAACEALNSATEKSVEEMRREYKRRRQLVVEGLNKIGLKCIKPDGAFYVFVDITKTKLSSLDFANKLLKSKKVAVVPGTAFGDIAEGYIRISYASSYDNLKEALARIERFLSKIK